MLELFLGAIILLLGAVIFLLWNRIQELSNYTNTLAYSKQSQSVKYGKMSEQWLPLSESFPYDKNRFRFLGNPIDGVAFLDDKIVFCEFKSGNATLSHGQKKIKELVQQKKVEWSELRVNVKEEE